MMKRMYIVLIFIAFISCSESAIQIENNFNKHPSDPYMATIKNSENDRFIQLCRQLPYIGLPFEMYCEACCVYPKLNQEQSKINEYLPEGASFIGVIGIEDNFISLFITYPADWIIPAVATFDLNGNQINEEVFMGGYCGNDYGYIGKQYFYINSFRELLEIDTSFYISYDKHDRVKDTTKIEIENKRFNITDKGEIITF